MSSPPNPPQVAAGASKPPLNAAILVPLTQRSAECIPAGPPSLLFCRLVQANSPQGSFGQMGENQEDQGGGAPWQAGHLDPARQRSIRAMLCRGCTSLPFSHLSAHIQPRLGFKQKDQCGFHKNTPVLAPSSPHPSTSLFMRAKRGPESLPEVQQMWTKAFTDARAGIDAVHPLLVLSGLAGGVSGADPPPCLATLAAAPPHNWMIIYPQISLQPDLPFPVTTLYHISHRISSDAHCSTEQQGTRREGTTCGITRRGCVSTTPTTGATASRTAPIAPLPMVQMTLGRLYTTAGTKLWDD